MTTETFDTGAIRDTQTNKIRFELLPMRALARVALHYTKAGGTLDKPKYPYNNWRKGIPIHRMIASMLRHLYAYIMGNRAEDHLAALAFNVLCILEYEEWKRPDLFSETICNSRCSLSDQELKLLESYYA